MSPLYTIIIPHLNTPTLLKRCLNSIPVRDDVQVIVVDDNSDVGCLQILKGMEEHFPNVVFFYLDTRGGAGHARNIGLEHSAGKWLIFADSDDFFVDDFCIILDKYSVASEDILYFRNLSVFSDDPKVVSHRDDWLDNLFNSYFVEKNEILIRCNHCAPWSKIIRKTLVDCNNIRFDEIPFSNDVMFAIVAGCLAPKVRIINHPLYVLTERQGSLTSDFATKPMELEIRAKVCFRALEFIRKFDDSYLPYFHYFRLSSTPSHFLSLLFHTDKSSYSLFFFPYLYAYPSICLALKKIRIWEKSRIDKIWLYLYSFFLIIKRHFIHAI